MVVNRVATAAAREATVASRAATAVATVVVSSGFAIEFL
jgi:hypothetical protein